MKKSIIDAFDSFFGEQNSSIPETPRLPKQIEQLFSVDTSKPKIQKSESVDSLSFLSSLRERNKSNRPAMMEGFYEKILYSLCKYLQPKELAKISYLSKKAYEVANSDSLWKDLCKQQLLTDGEFQRLERSKKVSWKKIYEQEFCACDVYFVGNQVHGISDKEIPTWLHQLKGKRVVKIFGKYVITDDNLLFELVPDSSAPSKFIDYRAVLQHMLDKMPSIIDGKPNLLGELIYVDTMDGNLLGLLFDSGIFFSKHSKQKATELERLDSVSPSTYQTLSQGRLITDYYGSRNVKMIANGFVLTRKGEVFSPDNSKVFEKNVIDKIAPINNGCIALTNDGKLKIYHSGKYLSVPTLEEIQVIDVATSSDTFALITENEVKWCNASDGKMKQTIEIACRKVSCSNDHLVMMNSENEVLAIGGKYSSVGKSTQFFRK